MTGEAARKLVTQRRSRSPGVLGDSWILVRGQGAAAPRLVDTRQRLTFSSLPFSRVLAVLLVSSRLPREEFVPQVAEHFQTRVFGVLEDKAGSVNDADYGDNQSLCCQIVLGTPLYPRRRSRVELRGES